MGDGVVVTATVVAIDRVDRNIGLRGPDGNVFTIEVMPAARNFYQIRVGDQVKVEYYEAVFLYIGKHGEKAEAEASRAPATSDKGQKPEPVAVEAVDVFASIPSHQVAETIIMKYSGRHDWQGGSSYLPPAQNPEKIEKLLTEILERIDIIEQPWVMFAGFNDWAADYRLNYLVPFSEGNGVKSQVHCAI